MARGTVAAQWPGILVPAESLHQPRTRALAALLWGAPGAVLSGPTALAVHGCAPVPAATYLTVVHDRRPPRGSGLVVRQSRVRESEVVELDGLRTQVLDVVLTEVLCTAGDETFASACLRRTLSVVTPAAARELVELVRWRIATRADRRGTRRALALLAACHPVDDRAVREGGGSEGADVEESERSASRTGVAAGQRAQFGHVVVRRSGPLGGLGDQSQITRGGQTALVGVEHVQPGECGAVQGVDP